MLNFRSLLLLLLLSGIAPRVEGAGAKINKVLVHFLDQQGRHTLAPSLFERDAYQAYLRQHPNERSALRFDVHWKATGAHGSNLKLRLELRGSQGDLTKPVVIETSVKASGIFGRWSALTRTGEDYQKLGELVSWRATLWDGETLLAEQKSFLW